MNDLEDHIREIDVDQNVNPQHNLEADIEIDQEHPGIGLKNVDLIVLIGNLHIRDQDQGIEMKNLQLGRELLLSLQKRVRKRKKKRRKWRQMLKK